MKIEDWLKASTRRLKAAGVSTARLDCLVLLEDTLNTNRTQILVSPEQQLTEVQFAKLQGLIQKRAQHIPLAYLRHKTEFYGREFYIDERVLEPRPETETMIDMLKRLRLKRSAMLADIGSGSGALGITAKLEAPGLSLTLIEIDSDALAVSRRNVERHKIVAQTRLQDLLRGDDEHYDVLLCNLPYVPDGFRINTAALHEPRLAIFGGPDGLDIYRHLFGQMTVRPVKPEWILTEAMPPQHPELARIAYQAGYRESVADDFIQLFMPTQS